MPTQLNLGCGDTAPDGWINCDSSWHAQVSRVPLLHDALRRAGWVSAARWPKGVRYLSLGRRFPWSNATVDVAYASHVFEHLSQRDRENFLRECRRVLKPRGVLRLVVPDLLYHARKYVESWSEQHSDAESFLSSANLRLPDSRSLIHRLYNLATGHPSIHKDMYDAVTLKALIEQHGFTEIRSSIYGESRHIANIREVEFGRNCYEGSLYLEGVTG